MSQPITQPCSLDAFFAWQEHQPDRYELVDGQPLRTMAGATNVHDDIVTNMIVLLGNLLRGSGCRPFTGNGAIETYPGQIRRPDVGVDCGRREPGAFKAASPRLVAEVLSPSTRDFNSFGKLAEYKSVGSIDYIMLVEPNAPEVVVWSRDDNRDWTERTIRGLDESIALPTLGFDLPLAAIYETVAFPPRPRLVSL